MKASKFTESQIAFVLKQGEEGTAVAEICRKAVSGLLPSAVKRLKPARRRLFIDIFGVLGA